MKIGSIVVKCKQFDKMLSFWMEALHYVPGVTADSGFVILRDPDRRAPNISIDKALDGERVGSTRHPRLHLDLYTDDQEGEVERLLRIGATRHRQKYDPEDDFIVLEDPDGNLFCMVQT